MTSRRPMARSFSSNGRTSSFSDEDSSSSNGRNTYLSNVRPENRSTLCSVMAQLTEDIQPSFETTLKSKAVSENCNVKFTCVVSGYPAPELKWYKDDMEMDRYCGLPKYEIRRNGKNHSLHIYNCTLDDAAIYQVSACNSKGIVSCSGVLEVGTMNEYKIHQRFFAKLKQKAEKRRNELDEPPKTEDKENIKTEMPQRSPEPPPRKRANPVPQERPVVKEQTPSEQLGAAAEPNGVSSDVVAPVTSKDLEKEISPPVETSAKKKIKMSNGVDAGPNSSSNSSSANSNSRSHMMGNGGENCYDGGISLAQFLSETLQSQGSEKPKEVNISTVNDSKEKEGVQKEREEKETTLKDEYEREKKREETIEIEKERERPSEMSHTAAHNKHGPEVKHHSKTHKDPDHHNIQASLSSMLHTVKDFLFGKSKKESHDQTEREFDHDSIQPRQPETPPSFRLRQEYPEVTVVEDVVPMETDQPKDTSESVEIEQKSLSSETREHRHEDAVLRSDLPSAHKLPTEGAEEQIVKVTEDVVEAMEMSVEAANTSPHEEKLLSGLQVLTQMENKDCQVVTVQPHVKQQEPECMTVSPQLNLQASRGESSPWGDISALPQTKTPYEEECPPTSTLTNLEDSRTPPHSAISVSNSHSLEQAPTEMVREEQLTIDKISNRGKPVTEERRSSIKLCEEEKAEVKSSKQPCSDINRSEITEFTTYSLEERIEPRESKRPDQVVLPQSALVAHAPESDYVKEGTKCVSVVQEMNVGFPPTEASVSFKKVDLKKQQECTPIIEEESAEVPNISTIHSSDSGFRSNKERSDPKEVLNSAVEEDLEVNLCNSSNAQERAIIESSEVRNEGLLFEVKKEACVEETKILSVTQNEGSHVNVLEEQSQIAHQEGGERQFSWPSDNIPQIQISSIEDTIDITLTVPDVKQHEHFEIPKIEIMEPEVKESTLPLTVLALNKTESEPLVLQKNETAHASEITLQDQGMTDLPHLLATQKGIQNDNNFSPTEILKEVAQLDDKTKMLEMQRPQVKSSEQLPQMDYASIPVINVSCTDDTGSDSSVKANVSHDKVPLFVVPPISVTCHESESGSSLPTLSEWTETETLAATQRGTEPVGDSIVAPDLEKTQSTKQNLEEVIEKSLKENTPPLPCETLLPKVVASLPSLNKPTEDNGAIEILKIKPHKEAKVENSMLFEDLQRNRSSVERLSCKPPAHPSLSPGSLRKFMSKAAPDSDNVGDKVDEDGSGGSTPTSSLSCESSPRMKRRDSLTLIRSATPEELASGARRKIFIPKAIDDAQGAAVDAQVKKENPYMSPSQARRAALLQAPTGQNTPPMERRSPLLSRRKATLEVPKVVEEIPKEEPVTKKEEKPAEKKPDPLKAPQVIRKIRGEPFPDASGHLKLWCQFFNVLSDSTIKWFRDEEEILAVNKSGGDESQVALAIVLASSHDCGVYGCTISNEHGSDTTDFLLSVDILSEILLRDDLEVGEEIEMTPLLFTKGLADCGSWGDKYFGRIMTEMLHMGEGCAHKASRVRVIYGLDPVFDSGTNCIIKVQNPIAYGTKQDNSLAERNLVVTKQECKVQNTIREYCKIFAAEARVIENFGFSLEVIPQYLMYRPANTVPYATVEADLDGVFLKYCMMDPKGRLITRTTSEVEQKCSTFQHWIHQWTHGNLLVTRLEGVETKLTNVRVVTKSKGYQGLTERASPEVFEQFITHHQCNYYCGLLSLRPLKSMDSLQQPTKMKGSRSPLLNRKLGSNSPQLQRKGHSPQLSRKATSSPKVTRKAPEAEDNKLDVKPMPAVTSDGVEIR